MTPSRDETFCRNGCVRRCSSLKRCKRGPAVTRLGAGFHCAPIKLERSAAPAVAPLRGCAKVSGGTWTHRGHSELFQSPARLRPRALFVPTLRSNLRRADGRVITSVARLFHYVVLNLFFFFRLVPAGQTHSCPQRTKDVFILKTTLSSRSRRTAELLL